MSLFGQIISRVTGFRSRGEKIVDHLEHHKRYIIKYDVVFEKFLEGIVYRKQAIAELFLYRVWTAQCGFRICSSYPKTIDRLLHSIVNTASTIGRAHLAAIHDVHCEQLYNGEFIEVIDSRLKEYDRIYLEGRTGKDLLVTIPITMAVAKNCKQENVLMAMRLAADYINVLNDIKREAIEKKLLF